MKWITRITAIFLLVVFQTEISQANLVTGTLKYSRQFAEIIQGIRENRTLAETIVKKEADQRALRAILEGGSEAEATIHLWTISPGPATTLEHTFLSSWAKDERRLDYIVSTVRAMKLDDRKLIVRKFIYFAGVNHIPEERIETVEKIVLQDDAKVAYETIKQLKPSKVPGDIQILQFLDLTVNQDLTIKLLFSEEELKTAWASLFSKAEKTSATPKSSKASWYSKRAHKLYTWAVGLKEALLEGQIIKKSEQFEEVGALIALPPAPIRPSVDFTHSDLKQVKDMLAFLKLKLSSHEAQAAVQAYKDALQKSDASLAEGADVEAQAAAAVSKPTAPFELATQEIVDQLEKVVPELENFYP